MSDQGNEPKRAATPDDGVLRPFEASEIEPLPPVQPSAVVVPGTGEEPLVEFVEVDVDSGPSRVARSDAWSPDAADEAAWFDTGTDRHAGPKDAPSSVRREPGVADARAGITLPRGPFFVGVGAMVLLAVGLFVLWQGAAGDDEAREDEAVGSATGNEAVDAETDDDRGVTESATAVTPEAVAELEAALVEAQADQLSLEAQLAALPPPAIRGDEMRRVVVAADASFVSVGSQSVAVIGPFGGYAAIDPATNAITATAQVASGATRVLRTNAAVWITNYADDEIVRIDPIASTVRASIAFPEPDGLAKLGGTLVVASHDGGFVAQVDPSDEAVVRQVDVGGQPTEVLVTEDEGAIWAALYDTGELVRIDALTFEVTNRLTVGSGPVGISAAGDRLWVVNHLEGTVVGVDLATETVTSNFSVGAGPTAALVFDDALWVTVTDAGELLELDVETGEAISRTPLGTSNRGGPTGLAIGDGSLWVAMQGERSVVRITPVAG